MSKISKSIEIVISTNKKLSSMSLDSRREIRDVLSKEYSDVRITDVNVRSDLEEVIARKPDLVFLGMKFIPNDVALSGSKVWLSQELAEAGIAYTGSDNVASKLEHNKHLAKQKVVSQGLTTARSQLIKQMDTYSETDITVPYPVFIKPVDGGGGSGINELSLAHNFNELQLQVTAMTTTLRTDALLESYLPGREFSVGLLRKPGTNNFHLLPLEIIAPINQSGARFLSSRIKRADAEQTLEITDHDLKSKLNELALDVFNTLGAQDYGRIDIRLDAQGTPHFLEANLLPSLLNNYGNLPKACLLNIQLAHNKLILQIAELALSKNAKHFIQLSNPLNYLSDGGLQELRLQPAA